MALRFSLPYRPRSVAFVVRHYPTNLALARGVRRRWAWSDDGVMAAVERELSRQWMGHHRVRILVKVVG
jgi:hypothetical protein